MISAHRSNSASSSAVIRTPRGKISLNSSAVVAVQHQRPPVPAVPVADLVTVPAAVTAAAAVVGPVVPVEADAQIQQRPQGGVGDQQRRGELPRREQPRGDPVQVRIPIAIAPICNGNAYAALAGVRATAAAANIGHRGSGTPAQIGDQHRAPGAERRHARPLPSSPAWS